VLVDKKQDGPRFRPPRDGLVREQSGGSELVRFQEAASPDGAPVLTGHFAVFDTWSEINSMFEGNFLERIAPGAFKKTFGDNAQNIRVTFNHGHDVLGDQALGRIAELREDPTGAYYEVELFRSLPPLLMDGLAAGQYGASFRFRVMREDIVDNPGRSDYNPKGLPERTIKEAAVAEFGPVTFPAYPEATAGVRSATDEYIMEKFVADPERVKSMLGGNKAQKPNYNITVNGAPYEPRSAEPNVSTPTADAPSEDRAAEEHPEPERREEPEAQATQPDPERTEPVDPNRSLEELRSRDVEIGEELQRLDADAGTGILSATQKAQWDALDQEQTELRTQIQAKEERLARLAKAGPTPSPAQSEPGFKNAPNVIVDRGDSIYDLSTIRNAFDNPAAAARELKDRALRSIEREEKNFPAERGTTAEDLQTNVESLLTNAVDPQGEIARRILVTGHPEYADAFWNKLRGRMTSRRQDEILERALGVATSGYAMPYTLDPTVLLTSNGAVNPLRQISRVVQISGQTWNGVNSAGVTASFDSEASEVSDDTPTLSQPTVTTLKAQAFVPFSIESEQWSDIRNELAREIRDSKDVLEASKFTVGTGTSEPTGVITGATLLATTAGSAVVALADIDTLMDSLPPRFQANAKLLANRKFFSKIRQLSRTAGVNDQWPNVAPGQPGTINGVPTYECSDVVSTITTVAALVAAYGDFEAGFLIVDSIGLNVEYVPTLLHTSNNRPSGQRGLHAYWMTNSVVRSTAPLRVLKIGT
jgi:HK97 family phage major capsid protein/HK97 family phage prohead protease